MAEAAGRLGFGTLHEAQKFHPRDWENPGRVRVQLKKDGRLVNDKVRNSKWLFLRCFTVGPERLISDCPLAVVTTTQPRLQRKSS